MSNKNDLPRISPGAWAELEKVGIAKLVQPMATALKATGKVIKKGLVGGAAAGAIGTAGYMAGRSATKKEDIRKARAARHPQYYNN